MRPSSSTAQSGWLRLLLAGLVAGAAAGLVASLLSVPLRSLANVTDRSIVNGYSITLGAVALWVALGLLYAWTQRRSAQAELWVAGAAAVVSVLVLLAVYSDRGPLAPYPDRLASLVIPLLVVIAVAGAIVFWLLSRVRLPLALATPAALAAAAVVAVVVVIGDKQAPVKFTLSKLPAAATQEVSQVKTGSVATVAPTTSVSAPGAAGAASPAAGSASAGATASVSQTSNGASQPSGASTPAPAAQAPGAGGTAGSPIHFTVASKTEAAYTVNEKLASLPAPSDAVGKTNAITGDLYLTTSSVAADPASSFSLDLTTLKSDAGARDNFLRRSTLQTAQFPTATYTITGVDGFPSGYKEGDQVNLTLHGNFTVHGVTAPLDWTGQAQYASGTLEAVVSTDFKMALFNITPPNTPVAKSSDAVHLDLHLFATRQPS